jgi:hypothetical protein
MITQDNAEAKLGKKLLQLVIASGVDRSRERSPATCPDGLLPKSCGGRGIPIDFAMFRRRPGIKAETSCHFNGSSQARFVSAVGG